MKYQRNYFEFRGGTCDANVFHDVVERNEYRLPDAFSPEDLILDVGAHIGSFSQACLERGARRILAFEPDPENYTRARRHLADAIATGYVVLLPAALSGSSGRIAKLTSYLQAETEINTGGSKVDAHTLLDVGLAQTWITQIFLGELPDSVANIALMKLDCEGSEWGILQMLRHDFKRHVHRVCGEYHPWRDFTKDNSKTEIRLLLERCGYNATVEPHDKTSGLGHFWGEKPSTLNPLKSTLP